MDLDEPIWAQKCFTWKVAFFQENQLGIGPVWRIVAEIGQKLDFRALFSEIYKKIGWFLSFGPDLVSYQMVYWLALWIPTQKIGVQIPLSPQFFFPFFS